VELPVLSTRTVALPDDAALLEWADPLHPAAFVRDGEGIVGVGERFRLEFTGPDRVARLAVAWRELAARARVEDAVDRPGTGLVAFGSIAFSDHSEATSVLVVPAAVVGRRDGATWLTTVDAAPPPDRSTLGTAPATELHAADTSPDAYRAAVAAATAAIRSGHLEKVVLARSLAGRIPANADRRAVLRRLADAYPLTAVFAVDGLLGASPETLVRVRDGRMSARVLAGTAARGASGTPDERAGAELAGNAKNRGEHELAVRSVLDVLSAHATNIQRSPEPFPLRLPNLWHLATDVSAELTPGRSALDLVAALHPTAAVAGTPTETALDLIADLEPLDRGRYAGPVGWIDDAGDGEWAIALRCAQVADDGAVTAWAGAGIVGDSNRTANSRRRNSSSVPSVTL
jgi:menaquinone-specific isochorismate synthase